MAFDLPEALTQWREVRRIGTQIEAWIVQIETGITLADGTKQDLATQTILDIRDQFNIVWPDFVAAKDAFTVAVNQTP